jgi:sterol 3beta-glucosyltransferase
MHPSTRKSSGSWDDDSLNSEPDQPVISKLFSDAGLYDRYLAEHGSESLYSAQGGANGVAGFADLIASGLNTPEKAITGRLAKLSVTGDSWTSGEQTSDPESYDTDSDTEDLVTLDEIEESAKEDLTPVLPRSSTLDGEKWKRCAEETMILLIQEFGPLAQEGEEEKLIVEADGAFFHQDVVILVCVYELWPPSLVLNVIRQGVIHLTTHRLAFHASLLATRPDLSPRQQVIKAGPAVIHRNSRWKKKRRVWMEISFDMLSTYSSSRDEDHIRPLRTVLCTSIHLIVCYPSDDARL